MNTITPTVGQIVTVYGQQCTITRVLPLGTIDVVAPSGQCYRITGLSFL